MNENFKQTNAKQGKDQYFSHQDYSVAGVLQQTPHQQPTLQNYTSGSSSVFILDSNYQQQQTINSNQKGFPALLQVPLSAMSLQPPSTIGSAGGPSLTKTAINTIGNHIPGSGTNTNTFIVSKCGFSTRPEVTKQQTAALSVYSGKNPSTGHHGN